MSCIEPTECDAPSPRARRRLSLRGELGALLLLAGDSRLNALEHLALEGRAILLVGGVAPDAGVPRRARQSDS